jgi:hypothetical protein
MANDDDLKPLQQDPRFKALLEKLRQKSAKSNQ